MLASYRVHEISSRDALTPGLSVLRTKVFCSLIACKTFYRQTCAKTSPILLFWPCSITASHSKTVSQTDKDQQRVLIKTRAPRLVMPIAGPSFLSEQQT